MGETYESIVLVKPEVFVYRIAALAGANQRHRAADWKLDEPDWTGRLRLVSVGEKLSLRLEDKNTGQLFANAPIDKYPSVAIEAVADSSRYFVLRLLNSNGQSAFVGIGFADRSDSFDLNVALMDHFKYLAKTEQMSKDAAAEVADPAPKLDLGFKEGQTITINIGNKSSSTRPRPAASTAGGAVPFLPPPPGASGSRTSGAPRNMAVTPTNADIGGLL